MKKTIYVLIACFILLAAALPVGTYAQEITTFGYNDNRTRIIEEKAYPTLFAQWYFETGKSYSQPLILDGSRFGKNKPVIVTMAGNYLYAFEDVNRSYEAQWIKNPWFYRDAIPGGFGEPASSHTTFFNNTFFTGAKDGKLYIHDLNNIIRNTSRLLAVGLEGSSITSAPLVTKYQGKILVVAGNGSGGKAVIITNFDKPIPDKFFINIGGTITSSPAPIDDLGFIIGLDGSTGKTMGFFFDEILEYENGYLNLKRNINPKWQITTPSGVPASFAIDGNFAYFSDKAGHFYKINKYSGELVWGVNDFAVSGTFTNRSPAVDESQVYFAITNYKGAGKGRLVVFDKNNKTLIGKDDYESRIVTAPAIWKQAEVVTVGTEDGSVVFTNMNTWRHNTTAKIFDAPVQTGKPQQRAEGFCGEISVAQGLLIAIGSDKNSPEGGWMAVYSVPSEPNDLYVKELDPGTTSTEEGKKYKGKVTFGVKAATKPVKAKFELTHNGFPISPVDNTEKIFQPDEEVTYDFEFTGQKLGSYSNIIAKIIPIEPDSDIDLLNNTKEVQIYNGADLVIKNLNPGSETYYVNNAYNGSVVVSNNSNYIVRDVTVKFFRGEAEIPGTRYSIPLIEENKSVTIPFMWKSPASKGEIIISASVNPDKVIPETNYSNNSIEQNIYINNDPSQKDGGLLKLTATPDPGETRSGWGFMLSAKTKTDDYVWYTTKKIYDDEGNVTGTKKVKHTRPCPGPKRVIAYFSDGKSVEMERINPGRPSSNTWQLPPNPKSPDLFRKKYIPVDTPDGKFITEIIAEDAGDSGEFTAKTFVTVTVKGSMWDDVGSRITQ